MPPVTLKNVAKRAGVSHVTVSNVLKDRPLASEATRARVLKIAAEMGYRPNASARVIRRGRFNAITLLLSTHEDRSELPKRMLYGIQTAANRHDLSLNVNLIDDVQLEQEGFIPKALSEWHSDGLLVNYHKQAPAGLQRLIDRYRIPSVFLNARGGHDTIRPDDRRAGRDATRRLLEMGHTRVGYVGYSYRHDNYHYSELDRRDGYIDAMKAAGLEPRAIDVYTPPMTSLSQMHAWWRSTLARADRPTAVICYGAIGLSIIQDEAARLGLTVPGDLSVVTFSGDPRFASVPLETWLTPDRAVGQAGVEMLLQKIADPTKPLRSRRLPFTLSDEGLSACPPGLSSPPTADRSWSLDPAGSTLSRPVSLSHV